MICTGYNEHIISLLNNQQILWKLVLNDGTEIWSDFDIPESKDPWDRAKIYCNNNNKEILKVYVIVPGDIPILIYEDDNGLNEFFIIRGIIKDINNNDPMVYRYMSFGKLEDDNLIHVRKFYWPHYEFSQSEEIRTITDENKKLLYKKVKRCSEKCKCQEKEQI